MVVLSESPGGGERRSPDLYRFKLGASAGFEATQEDSQGTPRLAAICQVSTDTCDGTGSQGVVRVWQAESHRPNRPKFGDVKKGLYTSQE